MNLRYITCSDPREHNSIKSIIDLAKMPHAEIAVQCHPSKMSPNKPRNIWFQELLRESMQLSHPINLAIHINSEWANDICAHGIIPDTIVQMLRLKNANNKPVIQRVQLNMPKTTADNIYTGLVAQMIRSFPNHEFIFQYNQDTKEAIEKLHKTDVKFSLLFDASGGNGIAPKSWEKPIYESHPMGYSGGMSAENVIGNLRKINTLVPKDDAIWIDAEGKLKSSDLFNEKPKFDVDLARAYITRANMWTKEKQR